MGNILMTMAEERLSTRDDYFAVLYSVDENDCFDFAAGLKALGHELFFTNWDDLSGAEFTRMFHDNEKRFIKPLSLSSMDLIFVYKMEGFYFALDRFFRMVEIFERATPLVINHPATLRHNIDKRYLWDLEKKGVRVVPTRQPDEEVRQRLSEGQAFVLKPIRGERGRGVIKVERPSELKAIEGKEDEYLAQDFMPTIREGERSLVFLGFDYQHGVLKRPAADNPLEFRCNESLGGTVAVYEPTREELEFARSVLKAYASLDCPVHYSRIDFIQTKDGPTLIEAELINPSIYANYSNKGPEFGRKIARYFNSLMSR
jgi:glutathione synthase/RimK-type ligase-like ATP-grasp enzyme